MNPKSPLVRSPWIVLFFGLLSGFGLGFGLQYYLQNTVHLVSDPEKWSYTVGQSLAQNIKTQSQNLEFSIVGKSFVAGLKNDPAALSVDEQQKSMQLLQKKIQEKVEAEAEKNKAEAIDFLEKNKKRPGVIVTASGLQYEIVKLGKGKAPTEKDKVKVHYLGTLRDGKKFDASKDHGTEPFQAALTDVVKGWREGLQLMPEGSIFKLFLPPELAYGDQARPGIPPGSVLVFEIEMVKVLKGL